MNTEYPELFRTVEVVDADSFKKGVVEYLEGTAGWTVYYRFGGAGRGDSNLTHPFGIWGDGGASNFGSIRFKGEA